MIILMKESRLYQSYEIPNNMKMFLCVCVGVSKLVVTTREIKFKSWMFILKTPGGIS